MIVNLLGGITEVPRAYGNNNNKKMQINYLCFRSPVNNFHWCKYLIPNETFIFMPYLILC